MTNFEAIKNSDLEQLGHFLCDMVEDEFYKTHDDNKWMCDHCIMQERCSEIGNGWLQWLKEEKK